MIPLLHTTRDMEMCQVYAFYSTEREDQLNDSMIISVDPYFREAFETLELEDPMKMNFEGQSSFRPDSGYHDKQNF